MAVAKTYINTLQSAREQRGTMAPSCLFPVERFDHRKGLASLQIHKTICSQDGRIWSATPAGLSCYDGVTIKMYGHRQGMSNHGLRTIAIHSDNTLWVGSDVGIDVLDISSSEPKVLWSAPIGTVNCLEIDEGFAAIGTSNGLFFWRGGQDIFRCENNELARATITSVLIAKNNDVWVVGAGIGLYIVSAFNEKRNIPQRRKLTGNPIVLAHGPGKSVLIGADKGILNVDMSGGVLEFYPSDQPIGVLTWNGELIWASAGKNLFRINMNVPPTTKPDIVHEDVVAHHIMIDHFENVWISSGDQSLLRISGISRTLSGNFDLDIGPIMCVRRGPQGLLVGGSRGVVLENGAVILEWLGVWDVLVDEYGKVWAATDQGLYCMVNPHFTIPYYHAECDVIAAPCRALSFYNGLLYVSSIRGLAKIGPFGPEEICNPAGESLGYVYSLHLGPKGRLWIATLGKGLWRLDGDKLTRIHQTFIPDNVNIYSLCHSSVGDVFIAHDNWISKVDASGNFEHFVDTYEPIAAWSLQSLPGDRLAAGASKGLTIYNTIDGTSSRKLSGNFDDVPWEFTTSRSLAVLDENTVYCGLGSGLRRVNLDELAKLDLRPSGSLAFTEWRGVEPVINRHGVSSVTSGNWHLEIGIRTCWYLDECVMRERLVGFDEDWSPWKPLHAINYTALPKGQYKLEVEIHSPLAGTGPIEQIFEFVVI